MNKVNIKVDINVDELKKLQKTIKDKIYTKVGILTGFAQEQHSDSKLSNVEIGLIHEFGSLTRNIPQRSFLRMPINKKKKEIIKYLENYKEDFVNDLVDGDIEKIYELLGIKGEEIVQNAFETKGFGSWQELKPATIKRKKSDMPLIDTAQLRKSITSKVIKTI